MDNDIVTGSISQAGDSNPQYLIPLLPDIEDSLLRMLGVLATFERQDKPDWCFDLGYTHLGEFVGKTKRTAIRQVLKLVDLDLVTVTKMGRVESDERPNKIRVQWGK